MAPCRHRDDGRGHCIDCGDFIETSLGADDYEDDCPCSSNGHSWVESDDTDERYAHGEGRVYCEYCGQDGES